LVLTTEVRRMQWPDSPAPGAEVRERNVIGDVLIEVEPDDGAIVRSWKFFDIYDPERRGFGSYSTEFYKEVYEKVLDEPGRDWMHTNSLFYLAEEDAVLLSSPTMCALSKLDLGSGRLEWIIGLPDAWNAPWSDLRLEPEGELDWFCGQHAAEVTPRGTILVYDNHRPGFPGYPDVPDEENYSRALELEIDEDNGTVRQVWSYGGPDQDHFLSVFISEADSMPETGNVLLVNGGQMTDANGKPTGNFGAGHHWVSLVEVTRGESAEKVWEIVVDDPRGGWASYRAERIKSLYPELRGSPPPG
jgi:arylsulfate sulfotransferase